MTKVTTDWQKQNEREIKADLKTYDEATVLYDDEDIFYNSFDGGANLDGKNDTDFTDQEKNTTDFTPTEKDTTDFTPTEKNTTDFTKTTKNTTDWS